MLTDRDVHDLLHYEARSPVLSVYLNTDPAEGNADTYKLRLRSMLKDLGASTDVAAVTRYLDHEHDWSGRSLAIFSCAAEAYFKVYPLAVPIRSRAVVFDRPYVKPLAHLLDAYGGYGVAVVDKQGARLFSFHLGALQEQEGILGESVHHTQRGGGSQAAGRRGGSAGQTDYEEEVTERNIKSAVEFATHFFTQNNVRRIMIGGTDENVAMFRGQLPKAWQSLVVGSFPISMNASHPEVLQRAMEVGEKAERQREIHLAETVVTNAAKQRGGVINLEDTLGAIRDGRIQSLVLRDGYRAPGYHCLGCGNLSAAAVEHCPYCGGECEKIQDIVELAVRQVMQSGGEIEVLPAGQSFGQFAYIGAILRY